MLTYNVDLDVSAGAVPAVIYLKQYQTDVQLVFKLYTTVGTLSIGSTSDCSIRGTKSDGNGFSASATYSSSNQTVTFRVTSQMTAVYGKQPFELTLTDSTGKMITATFYLDIKRAALDGSTVSASEIRELVNALDHTSEILEAYNLAHYDNVPTSGSNKAVKSNGVYQAIQNLVQTIADTYELKLQYDNLPTQNSTKHVKSGGIYTAIENAKTPFDNAPISGSTKAVTSGGIYTAIENAKTLFDTTPTENSTKAVTSGGIYEALNNIENIVVTDPQSDGNIIIAFT